LSVTGLACSAATALKEAAPLRPASFSWVYIVSFSGVLAKITRSHVCGLVGLLLVVASYAPGLSQAKERAAAKAVTPTQSQPLQQPVATKRSLPRVAASASAGFSSAQIETQLHAIYTAIGNADNRKALHLAEQLTRAQPNFQLGQMLYADLLLAQTRPVALPGSAPEVLSRAAPGAITDLRAEAKARIKALQERPPAGTLPENLTALSSWNSQALAVDISKSRLYVFARNAAGQLQLVHDYYISIARLGAIKTNEGDLRTPLGPYFITSHLYPAQLPAFYGAGALPLNYPNPYDLRRGKTGSGIWLHGTPPQQYSRPPQASEGCVVLTNPDFSALAQTVTLRSTPVVIATSLRWVKTDTWQPGFNTAWQAWRSHKLQGTAASLAPFYYASFVGQGGQNWTNFYRQLQAEMGQSRSISANISKVSRIYWRESEDEEIVVTTFAQTLGSKEKNRRQYWRRKGSNPWRIFYESDV
jgi:lipoprotein-anchoring transpeptidase ErfK/SrfK